MRTLPLLGLILVLTSVFGIYYRSKNGVIRKKRRLHISQAEFAGSYGNRATILLFSTTFCTQCRATKSLIADVIKNQADISYIEVDTESNLELVRRVGIRSTPTTLFLDKGGFEIARATGAPKRDQLIKVIRAL
jgi:thioredoxin-related protein